MCAMKTKRYVILDRDGVINRDAEYVFRIEDMEILPGVVDGLKKMQRLGLGLVVVSNQSGIARGYYTLQDAEAFNNELAARLNSNGIKVEKFYMCPHHPEITGDCSCRKPKTKMVERAVQKLGFNPAEAFFIGDKDSDTQLGKNCGGTTFLINSGQYSQKIEPDFRVSNLVEAADIMTDITTSK